MDLFIVRAAISESRSSVVSSVSAHTNEKRQQVNCVASVHGALCFANPRTSRLVPARFLGQKLARFGHSASFAPRARPFPVALHFRMSACFTVALHFHLFHACGEIGKRVPHTIHSPAHLPGGITGDTYDTVGSIIGLCRDAG